MRRSVSTTCNPCHKNIKLCDWVHLAKLHFFLLTPIVGIIICPTHVHTHTHTYTQTHTHTQTHTNTHTLTHTLINSHPHIHILTHMKRKIHFTIKKILAHTYKPPFILSCCIKCDILKNSKCYVFRPTLVHEWKWRGITPKI